MAANGCFPVRHFCQNFPTPKRQRSRWFTDLGHGARQSQRWTYSRTQCGCRTQYCAQCCIPIPQKNNNNEKASQPGIPLISSWCSSVRAGSQPAACRVGSAERHWRVVRARHRPAGAGRPVMPGSTLVKPVTNLLSDRGTSVAPLALGTYQTTMIAHGNHARFIVNSHALSTLIRSQSIRQRWTCSKF